MAGYIMQSFVTSSSGQWRLLSSDWTQIDLAGLKLVNCSKSVPHLGNHHVIPCTRWEWIPLVDWLAKRLSPGSPGTARKLAPSEPHKTKACRPGRKAMDDKSAAQCSAAVPEERD